MKENKSKYLVLVLLVAVVAISACIQEESDQDDMNETVRDYLADANKTEVKDALEVINIELLKDIGYVKKTVKAGFIYVGPVADLGWTTAHDQGRQMVEDKFDWLETVFIESVSLGDAPAMIDRLVNDENCDIVFTTSFDFMDPTFEAAGRHPDTTFFHCSGYKKADNMGIYFADFYQLYYLNGLMAGAMTESNKLGYVGAHPIPEVVRHINAFALGAKEVNPEATVEVVWINDWYNPTKAKEAAQNLIGKGVDVLAFTEDSQTVVQEAEAATNAGNPVYSFSHYSPMGEFGPNSCISGQLVHWEDLYEIILQRFYTGVFVDDYDYLMAEGGVELGAKFGEPINPEFVDDLKAVEVEDPVMGKINVYDLIMARIAQMEQTSVAFDPFTGPIYDQNDNLKFVEGERASYLDLYGTDMNWFVKGVIGTVG